MVGKASAERRQERRAHLQWEEAQAQAREEVTAPSADAAEEQNKTRTKKPSKDRRAQRRAHLQWSQEDDDATSTLASCAGSVRSSLCTVSVEGACCEPAFLEAPTWDEEELPSSLTRSLDFSTPCSFPMRIQLAAEVVGEAVVRRSFIHIQEAKEEEAGTRSAPAIMLSSGFNMATGRHEDEEEEEVFEHGVCAILTYRSLDWYSNTIAVPSSKMAASLGVDAEDACSQCSTASTDVSEEHHACATGKTTFVELCALERPARRRSRRGSASFVAKP